jgi:hypothetical protein
VTRVIVFADVLGVHGVGEAGCWNSPEHNVRDWIVR